MQNEIPYSIYQNKIRFWFAGEYQLTIKLTDGTETISINYNLDLRLTSKYKYDIIEGEYKDPEQEEDPEEAPKDTPNKQDDN